MLANCKQCCEKILKTTGISSNGSNFVFVTESTITPKNGCRYLLVIPCSLLPTTAITTVGQLYVFVDNTYVPLQCVLGNYVYTDQIRSMNVNSCGNIVLRLVYGSTPAHFKIVNQQLCFSTAYGTPAEAQVKSANADDITSEQSSVQSDTQTATNPK